MRDLNSWTSDVLARLSPATPLGAAVYLLAFLSAALILSRTLRAAVHVAMARQGHLDRTTVSFLQRFGSVLIWVAALILYAHLIPVLRSMGTALLAGASVASVVIGLAAQSALGNLIAGLSITFYRPFGLGDTLQVAAPTGTEIGVVEALTLGYTILQAADGRRIVVPNNLAASQVTLNLGGAGFPMAPIRLHVQRGADIEAIRTEAASLAREHVGDAVEGCFVAKVDAKEVLLELRCRSASAADRDRQRSELMALLASRLGANAQGGPAITFD